MNKLALRVGAFLLGVALLAFLIIHSGPERLWLTLRSSVWVAAPLVALWGVVYACNARAWQLLIPDRPPEFTFWRAYLLTIRSFAVNFSTPALGLGGEPLKVTGSRPILGTHRAVGSVIGFRFLHSLSHVIVALTAMIPAVILLPHTAPILGMLGVATVAFAGVGYFMLSQHRDGIFERGVALLYRLGPLRRLAVRLEKHRGRMQELDRELTAIHAAPGQFKWALAAELTGRVLSTFEATLVVYGLGLGWDFPRAFVIANLASLLANLFFFMPFEVGAREGSMYLVYGWLGFGSKLGTSAALLSRVRELSWLAIGLLVFLLMGEAKPVAQHRRSPATPG